MSKTYYPTRAEYQALCEAMLKSYSITKGYRQTWKAVYTFIKAITGAEAHISNGKAVATVADVTTVVKAEYPKVK